MQSPVPASDALTWTAFLNVANTALIILAGFLAREAWTTMHRRLNALEDFRGDARERFASLEAATGVHPNRRYTDHNREE